MRRVAITGTGVVSPVGNSPALFFDNIMSGRSGVKRTSAPFAGRLSCRISAQAQFDPLEHFSKRQLALLDRNSQFALVAAAQAWKEAGLGLTDEERLRGGVSIGTSMGGVGTIEETYVNILVDNAERLKPFTVLLGMSNAAASHISMTYGLMGPCLSHTDACSSSAVAIGEAYRMIKDGYADVMVAGGTEALLCLGVIKSWESLGILAAEDKDDPAASCKPFSKDRTGLVLGEGAAVFVLEELASAKRRGAPVYAELAGYASTADTFHITKPSPEGQTRALKMALTSAGLNADEVDYINAHGTATELNDIVETQAIKAVLGVQAAKAAVSSTKSMHGHMMGAAGAAELLATVLAVKNQAVPPTANLKVPDPACDLDYVPNTGRGNVKVRAALSNSFAFGGTNAILAVKRHE